MSDAFMLGYPQMDKNHSEFLAFISELKKADKQTFAACFEAFVSHTEAHFEQENRLMEDYGFPAISEHRGEHQRVLSELKQFSQRVEKGSQLFARAWINEQALPWFQTHLSTMDAALAAHMKTAPKQQPIDDLASFSEISAADAQRMVNDPYTLIIDARDAMSYKAGHINGAMFLHDSLLTHLKDSPDLTRPVLVYCYQGNSSKDVARALAQSGYQDCYNLTGGYTAWQKYTQQQEEIA